MQLGFNFEKNIKNKEVDVHLLHDKQIEHL